MNPPFGDPSKISRKALEERYEYLSNDMSVCFVQRMLKLLEPSGRIGILSPRNPLFLETFSGYRRSFLLGSLIMRDLADLGFEVLDNAMIEVSAAVLEKPTAACSSDAITFFRLLGSKNKEYNLLTASQSLDDANTYHVEAESFKRIEATPFCYWLTPALRAQLAKMRLLKEIADTKWGLFTADDPRFLRAWWEVVPGKSWPAYFKGGAFARFIYLSDLVLDWRSEGKAIKENRDTKGRSRSRLPNPEFYFRPGLSFPNVTFKGLAIRALPKASIFSLKGPGIFPHDPEMMLSLMALLNTKLAELFVSAQSPTRRWDLAQISRIPIPEIPSARARELKELAVKCSHAEFTSWQFSEVSRVFCPLAAIRESKIEHEFIRRSEEIQISEETSHSLQEKIEKIAAKLYGLSKSDKECVSYFTGDVRSEAASEDEGEDGNESASSSVTSIKKFTTSQVSVWVGAPLGRWDIRYATGERQPPELPDLFDPLPVSPPCMLQNAEGLPVKPKDVPGDYPLRISWPGILVDDKNHPEDIVARVREAIEVIWKDRPDAIEQEACDILGVSDLRNYFRKPAKFFQDHLKRYSKSRRKAPIYWPLATESGTYTIWIYYHRLTDQTLFTCVKDYLKPKIEDVSRDIEYLQKDLAEGGTAKMRSDLEQLQDLRQELTDMQDELLRVAKLPYKPNLNDGVMITASPLWQLFRLKSWQKNLKDCWQKLGGGDYDWAHLAYSIWPDRVKEKCKTDRSIAIAHNLEHLCEVEIKKPKKKKTRKKSADLF